MNRYQIGALLILLLGGSALAGGQPQTHDGFFLRLATGFGGANTTGEEGNLRAELDGPASLVDIAIGGMVSENLALHGTLFGWSVQDPEAELVGFASGTIPGDLTMSAFGIGLTRYFMPTNLYLSASVGPGWLGLDIEGLPDGATDTGFAMEFLLGKEWWVSDNWGLGLSGVVSYHNIDDETATWSGASFGLLFSATFN